MAGFIDFGKLVTFDGHEDIIHIDWAVAGMSMGIAIVAIIFAGWLYAKKNDKPQRMADSVHWLWEAALHRFYWDEIYLFVTRRIIFDGICRPIAWFDRHVIDGAMNGLAYITNKTSFAIRGFQSGKVQMYLWWYLIGAVVLGLVVAICLS